MQFNFFKPFFFLKYECIEISPDSYMELSMPLLRKELNPGKGYFSWVLVINNFLFIICGNNRNYIFIAKYGFNTQVNWRGRVTHSEPLAPTGSQRELLINSGAIETFTTLISANFDSVDIHLMTQKSFLSAKTQVSLQVRVPNYCNLYMGTPFALSLRSPLECHQIVDCVVCLGNTSAVLHRCLWASRVAL